MMLVCVMMLDSNQLFISQKISIKTLKGEQFQVDAELTDTVG